jgi:hypothetical protein
MGCLMCASAICAGQHIIRARILPLCACPCAEAVKHGMDQKAPEEGVNDGVYHCVAGKSFASKSGSSRPHTCALTTVHPCQHRAVFADVNLYSSRCRQCWKVSAASQPGLLSSCVCDCNLTCTTGAISHGARQFMHLKVDTYHIILWKSK